MKLYLLLLLLRLKQLRLSLFLLRYLIRGWTIFTAILRHLLFVSV